MRFNYITATLAFFFPLKFPLAQKATQDHARVPQKHINFFIHHEMESRVSTKQNRSTSSLSSPIFQKKIRSIWLIFRKHQNVYQLSSKWLTSNAFSMLLILKITDFSTVCVCCMKTKNKHISQNNVFANFFL